LNVLFCSFSPWGDLLCLAARLLFLGGSVEAREKPQNAILNRLE
jgi:hypothetical protein